MRMIRQSAVTRWRRVGLTAIDMEQERNREVISCCCLLLMVFNKCSIKAKSSYIRFLYSDYIVNDTLWAISSILRF